MDLFTAEVGSHLWKMNTPESDHDWYTCYAGSTRSLLHGIPIQPTKPCVHTAENDYQFVEIGHCIQQLLKGNVNYLQMMTSPYIQKSPAYSRTIGYEIDTLKTYIENTPVRNIWYSANGMSISQERDADARAHVRDTQKSLRTAYRTLTFAQYVLMGYRYVYEPVDFDVSHEDIAILRQYCQSIFDKNPNGIEESFDEAFMRQRLYTIRMEILDIENDMPDL